MVGHRSKILGSNRNYSRRHCAFADVAAATFVQTSLRLVQSFGPIVHLQQPICGLVLRTALKMTLTSLLTVNLNQVGYGHDALMMNASEDASAAVANTFFGSIVQKKKYH